MLEHYNAQGFGVMTSAPIDATLYDKLDAICSKCKIEQINFSVLESERALYYDDILRCRYFGKQHKINQYGNISVVIDRNKAHKCHLIKMVFFKHIKYIFYKI